MSICKELEELIPAYVLDAVDDADRARIEKHLPHCANCAQLVESYRPVMDILPYAVPMVEPPADLKYRVLAAAMPKVAPAKPRVSLIPALSSFFSHVLRSPAFAAAMLLLVSGLVAWNIWLQNQITQQIAFNQQIQADIARNRALVSVISYADGAPKYMQATDAAPKAIGRLYAAPELNALALIVYDVPTLEAGKVYQIWLIDPAGDRTSGGTFTVDAQGRAWVLIRAPQSLDHYKSIGITVEPAGGSSKPTGPKMMGTNL
jgi:anti-sigma-K factor RskA